MAEAIFIDLPEGVRLGNENLIRVTELAGKKLLDLAARENKQNLLRIGITGGGCNGLTYRHRFVDGPKAGDILVSTAGVQILVDCKSALYLKGTELDYSNRLISGGFKFTNPNATSSCSCGESFSI